VLEYWKKLDRKTKLALIVMWTFLGWFIAGMFYGGSFMLFGDYPELACCFAGITLGIILIIYGFRSTYEIRLKK